MGDELFVKLQDCFTAGYTLPQYCIDNGIKKPLFVSEKKYELFLWEVYVQFHYDKRMMPQFSFIDADKATMMFYSVSSVRNLEIQQFSTMNLDNFDTIILLTKENVNVTDRRIIRFAELEQFFIHWTYIEIPILHFLQRYPKVKLILTDFPRVRRYESIKNFFSREEIWDDITLIRTLKDRKSDNIKTPFDKFGYTNQEVYELMVAPKIKTNFDGSTTMTDDNYPLMQIQNGKRLTAYQPEEFINRIYFFGTCHHYGITAPFDKTLESYLQKMLNENNLPYRVENESQCYAGRYQDIFYNLNKCNPLPGDIILIFCEGVNLSVTSLPFCDVSTAFDKPNDYQEIFTTRYHINEIGYKILAEKYFKFLSENNFFRDVEFNYPIPPPHVS